MMMMIIVIIILIANIYWVPTMHFSKHSQKPKKWLQLYFLDEDTKDKEVK